MWKFHLLFIWGGSLKKQIFLYSFLFLESSNIRKEAFIPQLPLYFG